MSHNPRKLLLLFFLVLLLLLMLLLFTDVIYDQYDHNNKKWRQKELKNSPWVIVRGGTGAPNAKICTGNPVYDLSLLLPLKLTCLLVQMRKPTHVCSFTHAPTSLYINLLYVCNYTPSPLVSLHLHLHSFSPSSLYQYIYDEYIYAYTPVLMLHRINKDPI